MKPAITYEHIDRYGQMLEGLIEAANAQTHGVVRRPRREVQDFVDALVDIGMLLNCQLSGRPLPDLRDLEEVNIKARQVIFTVRAHLARARRVPPSPGRRRPEVGSGTKASRRISGNGVG